MIFPIESVHRFWAGRTMPEEYYRYGLTWEQLNPGWQIVDWDERAVDLFRKDEELGLGPVFDSLYERDAGRHGVELYVQLADVVGYALIKRFGGVYVNCDMQPVRPLPPLPNKAWASYENDIGDVVNSVFGASRPEDPFWVDLIKRLPEKYFADPTAEMVLTTGPSLLTEIARKRPEDLHIFSKEVFNPVHWSKVEPGGDARGFLNSLPEETVALHHWGHKLTSRSNRVETATQ